MESLNSTSTPSWISTISNDSSSLKATVALLATVFLLRVYINLQGKHVIRPAPYFPVWMTLEGFVITTLFTAKTNLTRSSLAKLWFESCLNLVLYEF